MCRKMRSWTHKTLSLRILFLQQNRYHSSSQHICDHLPKPNWKLSPKGGSGCLLLCQSPLSQAGNSWRMMCSDHLPRAPSHCWLSPVPRGMKSTLDQASTYSAPRLPGSPPACTAAFLFCHAAAQLFSKQFCAADVPSPTCAFSLPLMTFFPWKQ